VKGVEMELRTNGLEEDEEEEDELDKEVYHVYSYYYTRAVLTIFNNLAYSPTWHFL